MNDLFLESGKSYDTSKGISTLLLQDLRSILLRCGPFDKNSSLEFVFLDSRINSWYNDLPKAESKSEQVDVIIKHLYERYNGIGENALVLFLRVLSDYCVNGDCPQKLAKLANELEAKVYGPRQISLPVVAVTMKYDEAEILIDSNRWRQDFLNTSVDSDALKARYGKQSRDDWLPFGRDLGNIREILQKFVKKNPISKNGEIFRIVFNFHSNEFFSKDPFIRRLALRNLKKRGCLFLVDGISLAHEKLREWFRQGLTGIERESVIFVMSPINPREDFLNKRLEKIICEFYPIFLDDYELDLSPHRGLCIGDQTELMRYLKISLGELNLATSHATIESWQEQFSEFGIHKHGMNAANMP